MSWAMGCVDTACWGFGMWRGLHAGHAAQGTGAPKFALLLVIDSVWSCKAADKAAGADYGLGYGGLLSDDVIWDLMGYPGESSKAADKAAGAAPTGAHFTGFRAPDASVMWTHMDEHRLCTAYGFSAHRDIADPQP